MRDVAFARTIELRTLWIRAREASISLLDWRRQCHSGPPLRRIGPKDIDSTPVFPRYYSPGLPPLGGLAISPAPAGTLGLSSPRGVGARAVRGRCRTHQRNCSHRATADCA